MLRYFGCGGIVGNIFAAIIVYELDMDAVYILFKGIYVVPYFAYN